jgi:hypothetical protein
MGFPFWSNDLDITLEEDCFGEVFYNALNDPKMKKPEELCKTGKMNFLAAS